MTLFSRITRQPAKRSILSLGGIFNVLLSVTTPSRSRSRK